MAWSVFRFITENVSQFRSCFLLSPVNQNRPRKIESGFRFLFLGATEADFSSRFSVGKDRQTSTERNEFRFSVHNRPCDYVRVVVNNRIYFVSYVYGSMTPIAPR